MWSWFLIVLVMCISLMISKIERLLLAFSILSLEKCLFKSLAYFWTGLFVFLLLLSFRNSVYILETIPLSDMFVCKYFLPFSGLSFQFIDSVLWCTKLKFWLNPTYVFFVVAYAFGVISVEFNVMKISLVLRVIKLQFLALGLQSILS